MNPKRNAKRFKSPVGAALTPQQKRQVKQIVEGHIEVKNASEGLSTTISNAGTITSYTTFAQGRQAYARVGDRIEIQELQFKYKITAPVGGLLTAADAYDTVRVIVFRWWADDSADVPTVAQILGVSLNAAHTDITTYNYNRDLAEKYKILYDKTHVVYNAPIWDGTAVRTEPGPGHVFASDTIRFPKGRLGNPQINYDSGVNTGWGNVYTLVVSDSVFTPHPAFVCSMLTEFHDA
jgi:hypothetical protein